MLSTISCFISLSCTTKTLDYLYVFTLMPCAVHGIFLPYIILAVVIDTFIFILFCFFLFFFLFFFFFFKLRQVSRSMQRERRSLKIEIRAAENCDVKVFFPFIFTSVQTVVDRTLSFKLLQTVRKPNVMCWIRLFTNCLFFDPIRNKCVRCSHLFMWPV